MATAARASAGYRVHQHEVERCESLSVSGYAEHSDEHVAKHGARSRMRQLPVRSETTEPGALSCHNQPRKTGLCWERNGAE